MTTSSDIGFNWIRQIRLTLSGFSNNSVDKIYTADGSENRLRIAARISKQFSMSTPTNIMICNLSPDTRSSLERGKTKIKIETCWRDGPRGGDWEEAFFGNLMSSQTYRSGTDLVTTIFAIPGLDGLSRANKNKMYKSISVKDVVNELAQEVASKSNGSVTCDQKNCQGIEGKIGEEGWGATGECKNSLNRLSYQYGFSWSITDKQFRATGDKTKGNKVTTIQDPELIDINPRFSGNLQWVTGISWTCQYNAALLPHDGIRFKSSIPENNQRYGDTYKIIEVTHDIDSHSSQSFITSGSAYAIPMG